LSFILTQKSDWQKRRYRGGSCGHRVGGWIVSGKVWPHRFSAQLPVWRKMAGQILCKQAGDRLRGPRAARLVGDHGDNQVFLIMKLTYDPRYNIAYIRLLKKKAQVETIQVSDELNIDIAPDGRVYGIELLNANKQLRGQDRGRLIVRNEAVGKEVELPLADA